VWRPAREDRDIASTMVYLKGVRNRDIQARLNKGSLAAFA
jgi:hypothetical protein